MRDKYYEEIKFGEKLIAIILKADYKSNRIRFFSPPEFSQQLGFLPHKKGNIIKPHFHKEVHRNISFTQEVLFIKKGKVVVNFYTLDKKYICSRKLNKGDFVFICYGGHGFNIVKDAEIIEVKQGPYMDKAHDKEVFEGIE